MGFFKNLFQSKKQKQQAEKYKIGMAKTRHGVLDHIKELLDGSTAIGDDLFDELEDVFIMADIGVDTVIKIVGHLRERVELDGIQDVEELKEILIDELFKLYVKDSIVSSNLDIRSGRTNVILFVGVNGVGKTTTIAKVAHEYKQKGKSVMMVAGDTFRAGAIEQLRIWAERTGVRFFAKGEGSDPSSVMYDAISLAEQEGIDLVLCDDRSEWPVPSEDLRRSHQSKRHRPDQTRRHRQRWNRAGHP
jgi:fused signal recognition particle receptor